MLTTRDDWWIQVMGHYRIPISDTAVSHDLNLPNRVRYIRFRPKTRQSHMSMRVEVYGCKGTV